MSLAYRGTRRDGVTPAGFDPASLSEAAEAPPPRITHARDVDAALGYDYNFIDYVFDVGVGARAYLDEPRAVHVGMPAARLAAPDLVAVLVYLQRRFDVIRCLEAEGYRDAWRVTGSPR
jgi:hypothetical protein